MATDKIAIYRPVANVPFMSKVVERVVTDQLQAYLDETDALDPFQLGLRPHHGTETVPFVFSVPSLFLPSSSRVG